MIIRKTNHIPVNRDDADDIPPALGVETCSRVPPCSARAPGRAGDAFPGNLNHATINIGDVLTEGSNPVRDYGPDQPRSLVIPLTIGGIRGAIVARFIDFRSFHAQPDSQQEKHHHVAR